MKISKLFILSLFCSLLLLSCGVGKQLKKADQMYDAGGYYQAAKMYRKIASKVDKDIQGEVYFRLAESNRKIGNTAAAITAYERAIRYKYPDPIIYLRSAEMLLIDESFKKEDIEKFQKQINAYQQLEPSDSRGRMVEESFKLSSKKSTNNTLQTKYKIENIKAINSGSHDFAPTYASSDFESLYFTSSRPEGEKRRKRYNVTGQKPTDIFKTVASKKGWLKPKSLIDAINEGHEEGACTFDKSYTVLYYTQCREERNEQLGCAIYSSKLNGDSWSEPEQLLLAADSFVVAHPSISDDNLSLFFTSDIPGGQGGLDLWKTTRANEGSPWGEPINLGSVINTKNDEVFPFVRGDSVLYFASNGHPGFGGLDIFRSNIQKDETFGAVLNIGQPINSYADDFSIIFEEDNERGYFASRRKGGRGGDDIYAFSLDIPVVEYFYRGTVRDAKTRRPIGKAEVKLTGSNGATLKKTTENNGSYEFRLSSNTDYIAVANYRGYFAQKSKRFSTNGLTASKNFIDTLYLTSFDKIVEIPNIYFDFGKATLSDASRTSLNELVNIMNENPTIIIDLYAHTDSRGSNEVNMTLSQRRAQSVVDYLVSNGIDEDRMKARGFGENEPRVVTKEIATQYPFLTAGRKLDEAFIEKLETEEQKEICHSLNRRTELQVISDNYYVD